MLSPIRVSIWKVRVNTLLGSVFLGTCALFAVWMIQNVVSGTDPVTKAFSESLYSRTEFPAQ